MTEYDYDYFIDRANHSWGEVIEDDKYYKDINLEDSFVTFYVYAFAHLGLPAPTRAQLELARFISSGEHPHRLIMAMRGLA